MRTLKAGKGRAIRSQSVKRLHGEGATKRRIMDMGITKGSGGACSQSCAFRGSH